MSSKDITKMLPKKNNRQTVRTFGTANEETKVFPKHQKDVIYTLAHISVTE